jgi:hypothetical protein
MESEGNSQKKANTNTHYFVMLGTCILPDMLAPQVHPESSLSVLCLHSRYEC